MTQTGINYVTLNLKSKKTDIMKKVAITLFTLSLISGIASCKDKEVEKNVTDMSQEVAEAVGELDNAMNGKVVVVAMNPKSNTKVNGTITLTQGISDVTMLVKLAGFTAGEHAIHVHENGDCSSDDGKSAGGHWNPKAEDHGKWGDHMHHAGDIGNLVADASGIATLEFSTDQWCLGCDDDTKNLMGKSFIVHAKADDFKTQPTGDAGGREACGVIE
jgi:Cu-Zn family superoxide dismutase